MKVFIGNIVKERSLPPKGTLLPETNLELVFRNEFINWDMFAKSLDLSYCRNLDE
jgi:hypothetical protein